MYYILWYAFCYFDISWASYHIFINILENISELLCLCAFFHQEQNSNVVLEQNKAMIIRRRNFEEIKHLFVNDFVGTYTELDTQKWLNWGHGHSFILKNWDFPENFCWSDFCMSAIRFYYKICLKYQKQIQTWFLTEERTFWTSNVIYNSYSCYFCYEVAVMKSM